MKLLILSIAFMTLVTCLKPINADVEVGMKHFSDTSGDSYFNIQSWRGIEIKYHSDDVFYFISQETGTAVMKSPVFDISFTGVGVGFKKPVTDSVSVYGQAGYYLVKTSIAGRVSCPKLSCGEGLYYGLNNMWASTHNYGLVVFDEYEVTSTDGYGITLGLELTHPISKNINVVIGGEYRVLSFTLGVHGMSPTFGDYDANGQRWETYFKGVDSTNFKIGLNYQF